MTYQNIILQQLDPSPWDFQCFMGIFAFLVTPVAPVESQISSYTLTSILLDCRRSCPAFCKAMSNFPVSAIKHLFPLENKLRLLGRFSNEAGCAQGAGGRKGAFASFALGSRETRWKLGRSEL